MRNLRFVLWTRTLPLVPSPAVNTREETVELLELDPPSYGVSTRGIYIIDDDGEQVFAGPFDSEIAAIAWIDLRQQNIVQHRQLEDSIMH
jgi:hypothetical protein